ncbi:MAG: quinoprotein dehydrogenase-associated putative ABC transporter substrate-binding protein [Gammaproteobacteria bacterium]
MAIGRICRLQAVGHENLMLLPGLPALLFLILAPVMAQAQPPSDNPIAVLKVCADPYLLPFSNRKKLGYENRIAELFAAELGAKLQYTFFPQRMGFIRNTLRAEVSNGSYKCDLVISAPAYFELAATTQAYYKSMYMMVYVKGRGLDEVTRPELLPEVVQRGKSIRFGLFDRGPEQLWVFKNNLMEYMVPYVSQPGALDANPGMDILQDLVDGKIDVTIVWGPVAGYFARQHRGKVELVMLPLQNDPDDPQMRFEYKVAMAVRYGEPAWKERVSRLITDNQGKIDTILKDYGIPLLPLDTTSPPVQDKD